jgi:DNA-binding HxlR family transcriptional regulator
MASPNAPGTGRPPDGAFCGVAAAAELLGDAWTLLLVRDLAGGPRRFTALQASTGISARVLTDRLRALCDRGLMTRRRYPEIPPRVEYELTEKGRDVLPILDALRAYGTKWLRPQPAAGPGPGDAAPPGGRGDSDDR